MSCLPVRRRSPQKKPGGYAWIDWQTRAKLRGPKKDETTLILYAREFPPEGDDCDARLICAAFELGLEALH